MALNKKGIVVDFIETDIRGAIHERNFNPKIHKRVRDLRPGETVIGFTPKPRLQFEEDEAQEVEQRDSWRAEMAGDPVPSEEVPEDYNDWKVDDLKAEIDARNDGRDEGDKIVPDGTLKADLVAALELDDEATDEGSSTPE